MQEEVKQVKNPACVVLEDKYSVWFCHNVTKKTP